MKKNFTVAEYAIAADILIVVAAVVAFSMRTLINQHAPPSATTTAPITTYKQPATGVYAIPPPPIKEAEKENAWTANANVNATAGVSPRPTIPTTNSAKTVSGAITATTTGKIGSPDSVARSTETATSSAADDSYHDTMPPGGSKWISTDTDASVNANATSGNLTTAARMQRAVPTTAISANRAAMPSVASSTTTPDLRCLTIATDFQQDCATANRWLDDIGTRYGAQMQRHYRWLTAAVVYDWRINGCSPSPCDANGTGRIQPPDYYGALGYDSPLGTCHSTTPTALHYDAACGNKDDVHGCTAARVMSTKRALGGVLEDDGKVHGLVRWSGDGLFYEGTIADVACANGCDVEFDHPCSLPSPLAVLFTYRGVMQTNGKASAINTWWYGEDPRAPGPWAAGWMVEAEP